MGTFSIHGGVKLKGEVTPQGAKNEALQVICACLLTKDKVIIDNIPEIIDVLKLIDLLSSLGVKVTRIKKNKYSFQADNVNIDYLNSKEFKTKGSSLRGSIMIVGPLLTRFGKGYIPKPGGDKIGRRRLDTHFLGLIKLGASFRYNKEEYFYGVEAKQLKGSYILLDQASVTGTANVLMASVLATGKTEIYNAACEPYIQQLCNMLIAMGADISGVGSNLLVVNGVKTLNGCNHTVLPDMIEIGSWIGLAVMTKSQITIKNVSWDNLGQIPNVFRKLGIKLITTMVNSFSGSKIQDAESGLRSYGRDALKKIVSSLETEGMGMSAEILLKAAVHKLKIIEVPRKEMYPNNVQTSSQNPLKHGLTVISTIFKLIIETKPLTAFGIPSLFLFIFSGISSFYVIEFYNQMSRLPVGLTLFTITLLTVGFFFILAGVILYVLSRISTKINFHQNE